MELFREERTPENPLYNLTNLLEIGKAYGIAIPNPNLPEQLGQEIEKIHCLTKKPPRGSVQQEMKAKGLTDDILRAGSFFTKLIKPWLASGSDVYKPSIDDVIKFCSKLTTGVDIIFYYAFSKTQSPGRTGSPDWKIDFAELEMLNYWYYVLLVAKRLGFDLRIILVDETPALPFDEYLGLKEEDLKTNQELFADFLAFNENPPIIYRSLLDSVFSPLGESFPQLYERRREEVLGMLEQQLSNNVISPETIRIATFLDCLPESTLNHFKINPEHLEQIIYSFKRGEFNPLLSIDQELLNYLINLTAHFASIMSLRSAARDMVIANGWLEKYPEYSDNRIYGGVTRSLRRWSFLPNPKRFNGKTVNPMHGLAIYDKEGNFLGVCPRRNLPPEARIIYWQNKKPVFVKI